MISDELKTAKKVVGINQATKALEKETARFVVVAKDADEKVLGPLLDLCREKSIEVKTAESMQELGNLCGIQVGAAAIAVLHN